MTDLTFYNKEGSPIAYTEDGTHIFLFNGKPVAYFYEDSIYSFSGKHLGRFINGWVRDNKGHCVFFTEYATGGPAKPAKRVKPAKSAKQAKPAKSARQARPARPANSSNWSNLSSELFFYQ